MANKLCFLFFMCFCTVANAQVNLSQGLMLYLPFSGNTLDASGNGNNGTNFGATLTTDAAGIPNSAYYFDGVNDHIDVPDNITLNFNDSLSMVAMVKLDHYYQGTCWNNRIFCKGTDVDAGWYGLNSSPGTAPITCANYDTLNTVLRGDVGNTNINLTGFLSNPQTVDLGKWYCLVATYKDSLVKVYVDGVLVYSYQRDPIGNNSLPLTIGYHNYPGNYYWWHGAIDEIRVYNRALNYAEILAVCNSCNIANAPTLNILNNNTTICNNTPTTLTATASGSNTPIQWLPAASLNIDTGNVVIASPTTTTTYYAFKNSQGCNLIENHNFQLDTATFSSGYIYTLPTAGNNTSDGQYTIAESPNPWNTSGATCTDHTTGLGNALIANGSSLPNTNVWQSTINVQPAKNYLFTFWASSWFSVSPASLQLKVNGVAVVGLPLNLSSTTCSWQQYSYVWNSGLSTSVNLAITDINTAIGGNDFMIDDIYFGELISAIDSVTITVAPINVTINGPTSICQGNTTILSTTNVGTYSWSTSGSPNFATTNTISVAPTSNTTYTLQVTNSSGCVGTNVHTVNIATITANAGLDASLCLGSSYTLQGSGGLNYLWSGNNLTNAFSANAVATPTTNATYTVMVTNATGCTSIDSVNITVNPIPTILTSNDTLVCNNATVSLLATGANNYSWLPAASLSNAFIPNPLATITGNTTYTVIGTSTNGCTASATVLVSTLPTPILSIVGNNTLCIGDTNILSATTNCVLTWQPNTFLNSINNTNVEVYPPISTVYTIQGVDAAGCFISTTFLINTEPLPKLSITKSNDLECSFTSAQLAATGASSYNWLPANTLNNSTIANPIASPTITTTYTVVGSNNGCISTDSITVNYFSSNLSKIFFPNAFSPNGDDVNDCFKLQHQHNFKNYNLKIFNRFGNLIYESDNADDCWNGEASNNQIVDLGTYFYIATMQNECGQLVLKGDIAVIK
jgi:gliding motility-associated-like protein